MREERETAYCQGKGVKRIHKWILHTNSIQCENSKDTLPRYTLLHSGRNERRYFIALTI